jgi:hypothetical protein
VAAPGAPFTYHIVYVLINCEECGTVMETYFGNPAASGEAATGSFKDWWVAKRDREVSDKETDEDLRYTGVNGEVDAAPPGGPDGSACSFDEVEKLVDGLFGDEEEYTVVLRLVRSC